MAEQALYFDNNTDSYEVKPLSALERFDLLE